MIVTTEYPDGDLTATIIFVAEMFALYRWPGRASLVASIASALVVIYVGIKWWLL